MRRIIVLGSTGSIGTQALDVIRANPRRFELVGLAAGSNAEILEQQAEQFQVEHTALGAAEAEQLVRDVEADVVLNAITGSIGLGSTLAALKAGRTLALANKESLIVGGELVKSAAAEGQIVPVDSEHSALAQALRSGTHDEIRRLVVTASGGPFRGRTRDEMTTVTPAEALAHPTWDMGRVVTTNSATLVNKGLEVIEAHLLFDVDYDDIQVVVHPQSIVHSMVEFIDRRHPLTCVCPSRWLWTGRIGSAASDDRWTGRRRPAGTSSRSMTRRSLPSRWRRAWVGQAGLSLPCSTRRTSRPSTPSTTGGCRSSASSTRSPGSWTRTRHRML
jgi:1-deoxy-D-xylulose-5-phosphate reductoisomerase